MATLYTYKRSPKIRHHVASAQLGYSVICFSAFHHVVPGMGRNDDIFEAIGTGLGDASTCMSASCSPCMGLKPGDPIMFVLEMGASADGCSSSADFMATFKVYITPQMCMGGPLGEIAGLLDMDCVEFGEVAYYPFLNMITLQINTPPVPRLPVPLVRARTELNLILGELTDAVKNHCNRHPEGSADQWNCLSTFYEARGNNQVTLKVEIGADLFFGSLAPVTLVTCGPDGSSRFQFQWQFAFACRTSLISFSFTFFFLLSSSLFFSLFLFFFLFLFQMFKKKYCLPFVPLAPNFSEARFGLRRPRRRSSLRRITETASAGNIRNMDAMAMINSSSSWTVTTMARRAVYWSRLSRIWQRYSNTWTLTVVICGHSPNRNCWGSYSF